LAVFLPPIEVAAKKYQVLENYIILIPSDLKEIRQKKVTNVFINDKQLIDSKLKIQGEWDVVFSYLFVPYPKIEELAVFQNTYPFEIDIPFINNDYEKNTDLNILDFQNSIHIIEVNWLTQPEADIVNLETSFEGENQVQAKVSAEIEIILKIQEGSKIEIHTSDRFNRQKIRDNSNSKKIWGSGNHFIKGKGGQ